LTRLSGKLRDWESPSELPDLLLHYKGSRNGHCGGTNPLRSDRRNNVKARKTGCGGVPATPGIMAPTGEKESEREKKKHFG
jgi:hypothetical protein